MSKKIILVSELVEKFKLNVVANKQFLSNKIEYVTISRVGLELTGNYIYDKIKSIVYLGSKESSYLKKLSTIEREKSIKGIIKCSPPVILLGKSFKYADLLIDFAKTFSHVPIVKTNYDFNEIYFTLANYLTHTMANYKQHHGTLLEVFGVGILLIGKPGIGKSEIAMELIRRGHIFVGDDAIDIARFGSVIRGRSSELTKGFIEVRGLGILDFNKTFGYHKMVDSTHIQVIIELVEQSNNLSSYERVGRVNYKKLLDINLHYYKIPITPGRRMSEIIECAISDFKLKKQGYDSTIELKERMKRMKNG